MDFQSLGSLIPHKQRYSHSQHYILCFILDTPHKGRYFHHCKGRRKVLRSPRHTPNAVSARLQLVRLKVAAVSSARPQLASALKPKFRFLPTSLGREFRAQHHLENLPLRASNSEREGETSPWR